MFTGVFGSLFMKTRTLCTSKLAVSSLDLLLLTVNFLLISRH
jgi:hypothetical protein